MKIGQFAFWFASIIVSASACTSARSPSPVAATHVVSGPSPGVAIRSVSAAPVVTQPQRRWSEERANQWYEARGSVVGVNYVPSSAVNQLEMWQADTFDPVLIDRELGWAESLGLTSLRVFLHDLAWREDASGFYQRMESFLGIAEKHRLRVLFVIFDGVWNPRPKAGKQPAARPFVHNSGWVQSPGAEILGDPARHAELEPYVKGVVGRFKDDDRIDAWDIFNEPDNENVGSYATVELQDKAARSLELMSKAFDWAREAGATQPLTAAPWLDSVDFSDAEHLPTSYRWMLENSDIISFHSYAGLERVRARVESLKRYGRPVICTEYMARPIGSTFEPVLGYFKREHVGGYSWGLVSGKSQTIYPWDSWSTPYTSAPRVWFHDILHEDGTPFDPKEVTYLRRLNGKLAPPRSDARAVASRQ